MDPISAVALLTSLILTVDNAVKLVRNITIVNDPKAIYIEKSLIAQRWRTKNWLDDWGEGLERRISPDKLRIVNSLQSDIEQIYERVQKLYTRFLPDVKSSPKNPKDLMKRLRWTDAYKDLHLLIKALKACNTALYEVAQPAPRYHESLGVAGATPPSPEDSIGDLSLHALLGQRNLSGTETPPDQLPVPLADNPDEYHRSRIARPLSTSIDKSANAVFALHKRCMVGLRLIAGESDKESIWEKPLMRLKIWASGLFKEPVPLDELLDDVEDGELVNEAMRAAIIGVYVDIALLESWSSLPQLMQHTLNLIVQYLGRLSGRREGSQRDHVQNINLAITAALGADKVWEIALERPTPNLDSTDATYETKTASEVAKAVECLFDLLPAIRALRRERLLDAEFERTEVVSQATPQRVGSQQESSDELARAAPTKRKFRDGASVGKPDASTTLVADYLLDKTLDEAVRMEDRMKLDEKVRREKGETVDEALSRLAKKERERLEEFRDTKKRKDPKAWSQKSLGRIQEILMEQNAKLMNAKPNTISSEKIIAELRECNTELWGLLNTSY